MLRTAVLRSAAAAAARVAARPAAAAVRTSSLRAATASRAAAAASVSRLRSPVAAARTYSSDSGSGLDKEQVEGRIMSLLHGFDKVNDVANIKPAAHFANDLGLDSLDTVEVVMAIEEEFSIEIPDKDADTIHSIDKAVEYILNHPHAT